MAISAKTIAQFVKATKDDATVVQKESIFYGKITSYDEEQKICYVKLDGSNIDLPIKRFTTTVNPDEIVTVMIKNHTAVITGNLKSPAAGTEQVNNVVNDKINEIRTATNEEIAALWADYIFE